MLGLNVNYFKDYVERYAPTELNYSTLKHIESILKNSKRFDTYDWDAVQKIALEDEIVALASIRNEDIPYDTRKTIMDKYKNSLSYPYFLYTIIHKKELTEYEIDRYTDELMLNKTTKALLSKHMDISIKMYGDKFTPEKPLNKGIATKLFQIYKDKQINATSNIQFRYFTLNENLNINQQKQQLLDDISSGIFDEDAITEIINNKNLPSDIRDRIFDMGCDFEGLRNITPHMVEEIYRVCVETLSEFNKTNNKDAIHFARDIMVLLIESQKMPVSCELDFVSRWKDLEKNVDSGLLTLFLDNCHHSTLIVSCDINRVSSRYIEYILSTDEICQKIPSNIREIATNKIIQELHNNKKLTSEMYGNASNNLVTTLVKNTSITPETYLLLQKYNNKLFEEALLQSSATHEKIIRDIQMLSEDDNFKFYADVNIEMQNHKLNNHIPQVMNTLMSLVRNRKTLLTHKNPLKMLDELRAYQIRFLNKDEMLQTIDIVKNCSEKYKHLEYLKEIANVFDALQNDKYKLELPFHSNPLFNYSHGWFQRNEDLMENGTFNELISNLKNIPMKELREIKDDTIAFMDECFSSCRISSTDIEMKCGFAESIIKQENLFNATNKLLNNRKREKEIEIYNEEVEF